jgi:presenilin-like A22 family membrane protease
MAERAGFEKPSVSAFPDFDKNPALDTEMRVFLGAMTGALVGAAVAVAVGIASGLGGDGVDVFVPFVAGGAVIGGLIGWKSAPERH